MSRATMRREKMPVVSLCGVTGLMRVGLAGVWAIGSAPLTGCGVDVDWRISSAFTKPQVRCSGHPVGR